MRLIKEIYLHSPKSFRLIRLDDNNSDRYLTYGHFKHYDYEGKFKGSGYKKYGDFIRKEIRSKHPYYYNNIYHL